MSFLAMIPVLPTADMERDIQWYEQKLGFRLSFGDSMYAGLRRDNMAIHLQWHACTPDDPLNGGSVIKIFVSNVKALFQELKDRGAVKDGALSTHTSWGTHEFGLYDLNKNAIFFVEDN